MAAGIDELGGAFLTRWSDSLDQIYFDFGVPATLTAGTGTGATPLSVTAIDKTEGLELTDQNGLQTIRPAACIRMSELTAANILHSDLETGSLLINEKTWRIHSHMLRPTPDGELKGEVIVFLLDENP